MLQLDGNVDIDNMDISTVEQNYDDLGPFPKVYMTNARSLFPKFNNFLEQIINYRIGVACVSETWEDSTNKKHQAKIKNLEHIVVLVFTSG